MATLDIDRKRKIITQTFDNFGHYTSSAAHQSSERSRERVDDSAKWVGATFEDGMRIMQEGYNPKQFAEGAARITFAATEAMRTQRFNEVQGMLSIGRYINGSEKPLLGRVWTCKARPVVRIIIEPTATADVSQAYLQRFGEAVFSLINLLERDGVTVSASILYSTDMFTHQDFDDRDADARGWTYNVLIPVKTAGYPSQPHVMSAAVHTFTFRGCFLHGLYAQHDMHNTALGGATMTLGRNSHMVTDRSKMPIKQGEECLKFTTLYSDDSAAEWVIKKHHEIANRVNKA